MIEQALRRMIVGLAAGLASTLAVPALAQDADRVLQDVEIARVRDDLFQVRSGRQSTVFLVTPVGIIVGDPLNWPTASWLKEELEARFPGHPVKYVVHSHHGFERADGGPVFRGAERIAHRHFNRELDLARTRMPVALERFDRNRNGTLERDELADAPHPEILGRRDHDRDGALTPNEILSGIPSIWRTYETRHRIALGGKTVELVHPGPAHAADMTVLFFPDERVLFAADPPPVSSTPFAFGGFRPGEVVQWLDAIAPLEFDILLDGDGNETPRSTLIELRDYLHDVVDVAARGRDHGSNLAELQATRALDARAGSPHYSARASHIAEVYRRLLMVRAEVTGAAMTHYSVRFSGYCADWSTCNTGGAIPIGTGSASISFGRFGAVFELTGGAQLWSSRASRFYAEDIAVRETRGALLFRYSTAPGRTLSYRVVAGISKTVADTRGMDRVTDALVAVGGRHAIAHRTSRLGLTAGVDVVRSIGGRFNLVLPVRVTHAREEATSTWPTQMDVQAGLGLTMRLVRRVTY